MRIHYLFERMIFLIKDKITLLSINYSFISDFFQEISSL